MSDMTSRARILIVEDESGIADTLQYVLKSDGFEPVWCATARDAIAQFKAALPALAILDVGLPDMNGFELFKRLQAIARDAGGVDVPMLFLTARSVLTCASTVRSKLSLPPSHTRSSSSSRVNTRPGRCTSSASRPYS